MLDSEQSFHQRPRLKLSFKQDRRVDEAWLIEKSHGIRRKKGRHGTYDPERLQPMQCLAQISRGTSKNRVEIRAECNGAEHKSFRAPWLLRPGFLATPAQQQEDEDDHDHEAKRSGPDKETAITGVASDKAAAQERGRCDGRGKQQRGFAKQALRRSGFALNHVLCEASGVTPKSDA